jgi:putative SOS response-associated peptidase YedK
VAAVRLDPQSGNRQLSFLRWGLIPSWALEPGMGNRLINARAETVASKPAFREAFKNGRCLILADGFYEWKKTPNGKRPYYIRLANDKPFAFAGLAEPWRRGERSTDSCTIITTDANDLTRDIHDRMPVILSPSDYDLWLDAEFAGEEKLLSMLQPYPSDEMVAYRIGPAVNNVRNDSPQCITPSGPGDERSPQGRLF